MVENKDFDLHGTGGTEVKGVKGFLRDFLAGICIGVAFIIPGFSGGSVAAILGVYQKMINAVANVFKEMKKSIITLLPIGLGLVIGAGALLFPLGYLLSVFPLPTVSFFVGLAIGAIPSMTARVKGKPDSNNIIALSIPLVLTLMISFIPGGADVNLFDISFGGYVLIFLVGMLGSCALVVPGISGSMLLLILGYYRPILNIFTEHLLLFKDIWHSILVIGVCGAGMAAGFFIISVIMKKCFEKYPRGTYFAIIGFIIGSLPAVYISTMKDAGMISNSFEIISVPSSPIHYVACLFLVIMGIGASYAFANFAERKAE